MSITLRRECPPARYRRRDFQITIRKENNMYFWNARAEYEDGTSVDVNFAYREDEAQ